MSVSLSDDDFAFYTSFLKEESGYNLTPEKGYLLESRLADVVKKHGFSNAADFTKALRKEVSPLLAPDLIEAMTVNETFFFRDKLPFETYREKVLPQLQEWSKYKPFRIWSAACSTGQEPYSMAMIMESYAEKFPNITYEIVATDINSRVLDIARQGVYSDLEVHRGLNDEYRYKYFKQVGNKWHLSDQIKRKVSFQKLNLLKDYSLTGSFDFILLRNVLIYFDQELKEKIFNKVSEKINSDGYLLLGAAEGIYDRDHVFYRCPHVQGLYRLREPAQSAFNAVNAKQS